LLWGKWRRRRKKNTKEKEVGRGGAANIHQLPDVCWLLIFKPTTNKSSFLYISLRFLFLFFSLSLFLLLFLFFFLYSFIRKHASAKKKKWWSSKNIF
jgi:hypothetical protein